jgi:hypothetical protein
MLYTPRGGGTVVSFCPKMEEIPKRGRCSETVTRHFCFVGSKNYCLVFEEKADFNLFSTYLKVYFPVFMYITNQV